MEYKITTEQILAMAKECPTAEKILKAGFPDAFRDEWVEVKMCDFEIESSKIPATGDLLLRDKRGRPGEQNGFEIIFDRRFNYGKYYKIEDGKIWRRK